MDWFDKDKEMIKLFEVSPLFLKVLEANFMAR